MVKQRLLIRLGSMGDVILATAAANALRDMWGDQCVDVLVKEAWAPLWRNHPAVRQIHAWRRRPLELYRWARTLRQLEYDEVIDLQASARTRTLLQIARYRGSVRRPKRYTVRRRLLVRWHRFGPPRDYRVLDAFVAASGSPGQASPSLHPGIEARAKAARLVPSLRTLIGLAPGARHETKRWPIQRYIALGRELVKQGNRPLPVFFGPEEDGLHAQWRVHWPGDGTWVPVRENIEVAAASLARLRGLVVNDTGLMHMAAAMDTPVIAFFGPTVRQFGFAPNGPSHRILETDGLACRPCTIHGGSRCPKGHFRCMLGQDVATVLQHVEELRGEVSGPPARERGRA